jgi:serine/threonine protein phosphatase PrpC
MAELRWGAATDPGRVRKANEDGVLAAPGVFAVADGMGGHAAGEVASAVALETVRARLDPQVATMASVTDVVRAANEAVHRRSVEDPATRGMGTTLTLMAPASGPDGDRLVLANVGDSRAYLLADGELRQLTRDHSYVEEMLAAGQITAEEARRHPHRHVVTRVLGVEPSVAVDTWLLTPERGDRYLLCSDGLINEVADEEIARLIVEADDPQSAAEALVHAANAAGGRDNISVVVIEVVDATGPPATRASDDRDPTAEDPAPTLPGTQTVGGWLSEDQSRQSRSTAATRRAAPLRRRWPRRRPRARRAPPPLPPLPSANAGSSRGAPSSSRRWCWPSSLWPSRSRPRSGAAATSWGTRTTRSRSSRAVPAACCGSSPPWPPPASSSATT